jgi:hypothetical protein
LVVSLDEDVNDAERLRHDPAMRWIVVNIACFVMHAEIFRHDFMIANKDLYEIPLSCNTEAMNLHLAEIAPTWESPTSHPFRDRVLAPFCKEY